MGQDTRRRVTACFVAVDNTTGRVAGYYTLSAGSVALSDLPDTVVKKLPRYPNVPVVRIGRLALDVSYQGLKLGGALLFDTLQRSINAEIAAFAAVVDANDDHAVRFYERYGFATLSGSIRLLFLPLNDAIRKLPNP